MNIFNLISRNVSRFTRNISFSTKQAVRSVSPAALAVVEGKRHLLTSEQVSLITSAAQAAVAEGLPEFKVSPATRAKLPAKLQEFDGNVLKAAATIASSLATEGVLSSTAQKAVAEVYACKAIATALRKQSATAELSTPRF